MEKIPLAGHIKVINNLRRDITWKIDEDDFLKIIINLPFELSTLIWKNVISDNLEIEELVSIIGSNKYLDEVIVDLLNECYCELDILYHESHIVSCQFKRPIGGSLNFGSRSFDDLIAFMRIREVSILYCDVYNIIKDKNSIPDSTDQFINLCKNPILSSLPKKFKHLLKSKWNLQITHLFQFGEPEYDFDFSKDLNKLPHLKVLLVNADSNSILIDILKFSQRLEEIEKLSIIIKKDFKLNEESSLLMQHCLNSNIDFTLKFKSVFPDPASKESNLTSFYDFGASVTLLCLKTFSNPVVGKSCLIPFKNLGELHINFFPKTKFYFSSLSNNSIKILVLSGVSNKVDLDFKSLKHLCKLKIINSRINSRSFNTLPKSLNHLIFQNNSNITSKGRVNFPVNLRTLMVESCPSNFPAIANSNSMNKLNFVQIDFNYEFNWADDNCNIEFNEEEVDESEYESGVDFDAYGEPLQNSKPERGEDILPKSFLQSLPNSVTHLQMYCGSLKNMQFNFNYLTRLEYFRLNGYDCSAFNFNLVPQNIKFFDLAVKKINFVINKLPSTLKSFATSLPLSVLKQCLRNSNLKQLRLTSLNNQIDLSKFNFGSIEYFCLKFYISSLYSSDLPMVTIIDVPGTLKRFNVAQKFDLYIPSATPNLERCGIIKLANKVNISSSNIKRPRYNH